jgi:hypothetical protein
MGNTHTGKALYRPIIKQHIEKRIQGHFHEINKNNIFFFYAAAIFGADETPGIFFMWPN